MNSNRLVSIISVFIILPKKNDQFMLTLICIPSWLTGLTNLLGTEAPTESYDTFDQIGTLRTVLFELCIFSFDASIFLLDFVKISRTLGGYSYSLCHITHDHHMVALLQRNEES